MPYLVREVIPPVRPCFLHATLLFQDRARNNAGQDGKGHRHPVVIVTMHRHILVQSRDRLPVDFQPVVQFLGLDTKLGCTNVSTCANR
jgi:hypothetical protein